jgi:tetratricopeptide (TPR) repeat protein
LENITGGAGLSWRRINMDEALKSYSYRLLFLKTKLALFYEQLAKLDPDNVDAHMGLGDVSYELDKYEEAITAYKEAVKRQPDHSLCHFNLAKTYLKMGDRDLALEQHEILKALDKELANNLDSMLTGGVLEAASKKS